MYHLASMELRKARQQFEAAPRYNHLLYSITKWEVIPLPKATGPTRGSRESPAEAKQGNSELTHWSRVFSCASEVVELFARGTTWGQECNQMQKATGLLGSYWSYSNS